MDWIYENNTDNSCRYVLGTVGNNPLICVGVNPSTAEENNLDRTLESVERIASLNGYDSWIMINLYPQRATNPKNLHLKSDECINKINLAHIENLLSNHKGADIWASWGTLISTRKYLKSSLKSIIDIAKKYDCNWISFGNKTKQGHPHHALYLAKNSKKEIDIFYPKNLKNFKLLNV